MEAIIAGDYAFEPEEYWSNVSDTARSFITECLTIDPTNRPTAEEALAHKWVHYLIILCLFTISSLTTSLLSMSLLACNRRTVLRTRSC